MSRLRWEDVVGRQNGRQPVGDDQARPPFHHPLQRLLDEDLGKRIEVGGGFVQAGISNPGR